MLLDQILAELLEKLSVPLNNRFLFLPALSLHLLVLFFEPAENVFEFISIGQDLNYSPHKSTIDILDKAFAIDIIDFLGVFQPQNRRYYVRKLLHLHFFQKLIALLVQVDALVFAQIVQIESIWIVACVLLEIIATIVARCVNHKTTWLFYFFSNGKLFGFFTKSSIVIVIF